MKGALVACLLFGIVAAVYGDNGYNNRVNGYSQVNSYQPINTPNYGLGSNNYGSNYGSCRPLGTPSQNIADCCSQSSAPIDRSNLNKCCLAQGQFCNGHNDKCCYANGQMDCVPTGNPNMGIRTCQRRVTVASNY